MTDTTLEREAMLAGRSRSANVRRFQYFADWELCQMAKAVDEYRQAWRNADLRGQAMLDELREELRHRKATTY